MSQEKYENVSIIKIISSKWKYNMCLIKYIIYNRRERERKIMKREICNKCINENKRNICSNVR